MTALLVICFACTTLTLHNKLAETRNMYTQSCDVTGMRVHILYCHRVLVSLTVKVPGICQIFSQALRIKHYFLTVVGPFIVL